MEEGEKFRAAKRVAETMLADGTQLEVVLSRLQVEGVTLVQSMLVLIRVQGISLAEAREIAQWPNITARPLRSPTNGLRAHGSPTPAAAIMTDAASSNHDLHRMVL